MNQHDEAAQGGAQGTDPDVSPDVRPGAGATPRDPVLGTTPKGTLGEAYQGGGDVTGVSPCPGGGANTATMTSTISPPQSRVATSWWSATARS